MPITPPQLWQYENMAHQAEGCSTLIECPANG